MIEWQAGVRWEQLEAAWLKSALEAHGGNKTHTARAIGMSLRTLRNKVKRYPELSSYRVEWVPPGPRWDK